MVAGQFGSSMGRGRAGEKGNLAPITLPSHFRPLGELRCNVLISGRMLTWLLNTK